MELWGHWDLHFLETEGPFSFLRVPTLLKLLRVCVSVCSNYMGAEQENKLINGTLLLETLSCALSL